MSTVESVNGKTGAVALPGLTSEGELPPSVMTSATESLGEVEGGIAPSLSAGKRVFLVTLKGPVVLSPPIEAPSVTTYVEVILTQNSTGAHSIETEGIAWIGGAPSFDIAANAVNVIQLIKPEGGALWYAMGAQEGEEGRQGPEGFSSPKLLLPSVVKTYKEPTSSEYETRKALAETHPRYLASEEFALTSGSPTVQAIAVPPKTLISGIGFEAFKLDTGTREHLWVALLNSAHEVLRLGLDYTSKSSVPLTLSRLNALRLASSYETGSEGELLYLLLCYVGSGPLGIAGRSTGSSPLTVEQSPVLAALGNSGQTNPEGLPSKVTLATTATKMGYLVAV